MTPVLGLEPEFQEQIWELLGVSHNASLSGSYFTSLRSPRAITMTSSETLKVFDNGIAK